MSGDNLTRDQVRVGGGGLIPHRFFFVCVQGDNLNVDFLRKNIWPGFLQIALWETVKVMEDEITLNWQSQNVVCYIIH